MKRKEFLMSLGLIGVAPKLLSKDTESTSIDNKETFKSNLVTLTTYQCGLLQDILDKDIVWIMKYNKENGEFITAIEGYVNSNLILLGGIGKVEVVIIRQITSITNDDSILLYHSKILADNHYYHRRISIDRIEG